MKQNIIKAICLSLCMLFSFSLSAQNAKPNPSRFVGDWSFSVPDAPYGYQDGTGVMKLTEGKLTAEFKLAGSTLKVNTFKELEDGYSCTVYVDGYPVDVVLKWKQDVLTGSADFDGELLPVKFKKTEK